MGIEAVLADLVVQVRELVKRERAAADDAPPTAEPPVGRPKSERDWMIALLRKMEWALRTPSERAAIMEFYGVAERIAALTLETVQQVKKLALQPAVRGEELAKLPLLRAETWELGVPARDLEMERLVHRAVQRLDARGKAMLTWVLEHPRTQALITHDAEGRYQVGVPPQESPGEREEYRPPGRKRVG